MFNKMLDTLDELLTQGLIKQFHCELKSGVLEKIFIHFRMETEELVGLLFLKNA